MIYLEYSLLSFVIKNFEVLSDEELENELMSIDFNEPNISSCFDWLIQNAGNYKDDKSFIESFEASSFGSFYKTISNHNELLADLSGTNKNKYEIITKLIKKHRYLKLKKDFKHYLQNSSISKDKTSLYQKELKKLLYEIN